MWIYCGGRTTGEVVHEVTGSLQERVLGVNMVEDIIGENRGNFERGQTVKGVLVTDMALMTLLNWEEVKKLAGRYKESKVMVVTTRVGELPTKESLPDNVTLIQVDAVRVDGLIHIMSGRGK